MEQQRRGTSSQPLDAGVNPAHIPGLTQPAPAEPEDAVEEETAKPAVPSADAPAEDAAPGPEEPDGSAEEAEPAEEPEPEAADGPVFEAADRRARIVADARGVRLSLDEEKCEFGWDEIGAVETAAPRFGKRFTVTVHTPERRWYPIEIEAASRADHKKWEERLDAVLDAYFEEGTEDTADTGDTEDASAKADDTP
ncbi:hypothetical protein AB0D49_04370 [Streptomyces sp. NPDC048290]|uniref:hypothetical protein n=1 Tax=Streptomyces sp. NPDC048290 TaxID=3155811 RepID=UPI003448A41B